MSKFELRKLAQEIIERLDRQRVRLVVSKGLEGVEVASLRYPAGQAAFRNPRTVIGVYSTTASFSMILEDLEYAYRSA